MIGRILLLFLFSFQAPDSSSEFERLSKAALDAHQAERVAEAIQLYEQALRIKPDWDRGWWHWGTMLYALDRHNEALEAFRKLILLQPKSGPVRAMLGLSELQLKDYERALHDLQNSRELGLGDNQMLISVVRYNTAILLNRFERFDAAFQVLKEFAHEASEDPSVVEAFGLAVLRLPYLPAELPADRYDLVRKAGAAAFEMAARRNQKAEELFRNLLKNYPDAPTVHYAYGLFLLSDRPDEAIAEFQRELERHPDHVAAHLKLAFEYFRRADYTSALPHARRAGELAPGSFEARLAIGQILLETGDLDASLKELQAAAQLAAENPEVHFALAKVFGRLGRKEEADTSRREFLRLQARPKP